MDGWISRAADNPALIIRRMLGVSLCFFLFLSLSLSPSLPVCLFCSLSPHAFSGPHYNPVFAHQ